MIMNFMQGICNYTPEIKQVSRVYNVAAILYLRLMLPVMLFPMLNIIIILVITTMFLGYIVVQLFCTYNMCYM